MVSSSIKTYSYLPDECWESIFRFIINQYQTVPHSFFSRHSESILNSLSLVSKQFLSITNRLRLSITVVNFSPTISIRPIFQRFTNLNSLKFALYNELDGFLCKISHFPLKKLTSLIISNRHTIPANGLRVFTQNITTLTSLTCFDIADFNTTDLFLIAECFPLLEELNLSFRSGWKNKNKVTHYNNYCDGVEALSLALLKLRKVNLSGFPMSDKSIFHLFNNCKLLEEVTMFWCDQMTIAGIASAIRERPTLRSLSFCNAFFNLKDAEVSVSSHFIDSLLSLKGLTSLTWWFLNISDEMLYSIAREGLPLTRLVLKYCFGHSYAGIFCLLSKCAGLQHLDLQRAGFLNDHYVDKLSLFLGDLVSINLSECMDLTYSTLFTLVRNCPSLSEIKMENIGSKSVENSDSLPDFGVFPQLKYLYLAENSWLSDENIIMFASIFPNLQLLDLNSCNHISEGICQVLRRCSNIRHLNLAHCSRVNLLGVNFVVPKLEVLKLSDTKVDDETLYVISKNCCGLLELFVDGCNDVTEKGVKHVKENCSQLREHGYVRSSP
ncbi:F-box/LRR protein, putative [Medicago truncatula]|uniref:F-box/LRR protein, putative n=2 Tax=Medicago truncatula TaxID=3880 RepID=A0A072VTJ7_MEDTR|nr:F-box/LRR protein, putative [Medicago truncatula]